MKVKRIVLFMVYALLLLSLQFYPYLIPFTPGDTNFATYDLSQHKVQSEIVTINGENIMGAVYYQWNSSNWLTYLTTTYDTRQQNTIDITVMLHNLNFEGHPNSSVIVLRDKVKDGIDRYPYTNLQIFNITSDNVTFSTIYRNSNHYYYQHLNREGKVVESVSVFDPTILSTYFNPDKMMEINTTTFGVVVGKYLSGGSSSGTGKYMLLYNRQTNQTEEIEMQFEVSSMVFNQDNEVFYAIYTNENGTDSMGKFDFHGKLDLYIADFSGFIDYLVDNSILLIRPSTSVVWGGLHYIFIVGFIIVGVMSIVMIYDWRKQKKMKEENALRTPYLMNQGKQ